MKPENLSENPVERKQIWLSNLSNFIVIANNRTWASDAAEVEPQRPGYKELQWPYSIMTPEQTEAYDGWEDWLLRDSYSGYFRAPGMTTVYYKGEPAWNMQYGGHGLTEGHEDQAKQTYEFLKSALRQVSPQLPFRGPKDFKIVSKRYEFTLLEGDITDCSWEEAIFEEGKMTFTQKGLAGIIIHRASDRKPILPWDL